MRYKTMIVFFILLIISSISVQAWKHELAAGYGVSEEIDYDYDSHAVFFYGKLFILSHIDTMLLATLDASVNYLTASTPYHRHLVAVALYPALRGYFAPPKQHHWRPYLLGTIGPAWLSSKEYGEAKQGGRFALQISLGGGFEVVKKNNGVDFNLRLVHYCNAGFFHPNESFNVLYLFSVGYLFS